MPKTIWEIDPNHSEIGFRVVHMMFTTILGRFDSFTVDVDVEEDNFEDAKINFLAEAKSINTHSEERDNHLRSADFFEVNTFPHLKFTSTSLAKINENKFIVKGLFTIRDVTKEIELEANYSGLMEDPTGDTRVAFALSSEINRTDFGMKWNKLLAKGGLYVSEEVKLLCNIELIKK